MAVAAVMGGATPNFDLLYKEIGRLTRKLSVASPRELNDPGQNLKLTSIPPAGQAPKVYDTYIKTYYDADYPTQNTAKKLDGRKVGYQLYYKDDNNNEIQITDGEQVKLPNAGADTGFQLNGTTLISGRILKSDPISGRIIYNTNRAFAYPGTTYDDYRNDSTNVTVGVMKLDGVTGLDVALINERISQFNLAIEALNKVLTVAVGNVDTAVNMRL